MASFNRKSKGDGNYYQHDDRDRGTSSFHSARRVSFKNTSRQQGYDNKLRKYIEDGGDVDMTINVRRRGNVRFNPLKGRLGQGGNRGGGNFSRGGGNFRAKGIQEGPSDWFKVTICHGKKYNRQEVMKKLQTFVQPVPFVPIGVKIEEDDMTFYVDNAKTANSINSANFRLQMGDGWKVQIKVKAEMPSVDLSPALKDKIKVVMSTKFDPSAQHLDLTRFYANDDFLNEDIFVPLNRQNIILAVFQIIAESIPNLRSLNLSDNKIFTAQHFSMLKKHCSELKTLNLSKNRIRDLSELKCLEGLRLQTLTLDLNPLCDKYQDQTSYVREVRKIFKTLLSLDGVDLPPPLTFDIEESQYKLPTSQGNYLCNGESRDFARLFLEEYYKMYDNAINRDALNDAYADTAQFSMNAFNLSGGVTVNNYITESRNLKKVNNFERRAKLLHVGKQEIVRFLNTLPKTKHDLPSFTVDVLVFTSSLISLCVTGVFKESEHVTPMKAFSRAFTLIRTATGFNIVNDILSITEASKEQAATAFEMPSTPISQEASTSLNTTPVTNPVPTVTPAASPQEMELKREMVVALSIQTGMNTDWSEKCLGDTNWDFHRALNAFNEFHRLNKIPPEAFQQ
ncbi:nuclear RNA export factor 1 [Planococcus citri]|uniref:nuclear RNA export factor 1 n=1 Tax=Planococcus citri TaxID=170843 RepID=UPI0031F88C9A